MSNNISVAILGYGTVGSGVFEVLRTNSGSIERRVGSQVSVKYVLDLRDFPGDPVEEVLVHDFEKIISDDEVKVVVETMGGLVPAYDFTKRSLLAGKSVCTSNKELVAEHGVELVGVAKEHGANYMFEASCGGGIPIIRAITDCLMADEIDSISGILNGTTNYILTKMTNEGSEFADALKEAQDNGYAERDPEADIEGHDAQRKIAILSSLAYGSHVDYKDINTEGISGVSASDIRYAKALGAHIKLLASSCLDGDKVSAGVYPVMPRADSPLYAVDDVFNAVLVHGNMLGDAMFYGSGAGRLPTASAVAADVVGCAKVLGKHVAIPSAGRELTVIPSGETVSRFFVRISGSEQERLAEIKQIFGDVVSVSVPGIEGEFGFVTEPVKEAAFNEKAASLDGICGHCMRVMF